ncbi:MAG: biotin transporter BioY [Acholeplasmataceae bacterium]
MTIKKMVKLATLSTLIAISTFISIPVGISGVSFTLQTFMIILIGLLINPLDAFLSVFIYVLVGLIGLPVFSNFQAGFTAIFSPTGGFIISFLIVAPLISVFKPKKNYKLMNFIVVFLFGFVLLYIIGGIHFSLITSTNLKTTYLNVFLPFYIWDLVKIVLVLITYNFIPKEILNKINM